MNTNLSGNASQVAAKKDEAEREIFPLGFQPRIPKTHEHRKGNRRNRSQTQMKGRYNPESADHQYGL
jgi:hypothetical protein